jgi:hypothetical protein
MFLKRKLQDDLFPVPVPFIVSAFVDLLYIKKYVIYVYQYMDHSKSLYGYFDTTDTFQRRF